MNHEINIRLADESDTSALVRFNQAMARETEDLELDLQTLTSGVENLLKNRESGFYLIAEVLNAEGREAVGSLMVTYEWSDWRNGLFWWIQSVYITQNFRRRGIYRRLYEFVKAMAGAQPDVRGFRLYVEKENRTAQLTYEKLGMAQTHYLMFEELIETKI